MKKSAYSSFYSLVMLLQLVFIISMVIFIFYVHLWAARQEAAIDTCIFYFRTKLLCPACGGTRALHYLGRGAFTDAFKHNALLLIPILIIPAAISLAGKLKHRGLHGPLLLQHINLWATVLFILIITFWIVRNIPAAHLLRPP